MNYQERYQERKARALTGVFNPQAQRDVLRAMVDLERDRNLWTIADVLRSSGWSRAYCEHAIQALVARGVLQAGDTFAQPLSARYRLSPRAGVDRAGRAYLLVQDCAT